MSASSVIFWMLLGGTLGMLIVWALLELWYKVIDRP